MGQAVFFDDQAIINEPRVATNADQADQFAAAFGQKKVGIQPGHGIFTTGASVDEAAWWFMSLDTACHVQLMVQAAGDDYERWPDEAARGIAKGLGSSQFGWLSFETLWDDIVADDPSFLS